MTFGAGMGSSAQWRRTWKWTCRRRRRTRTFAGGWSQCPWCSYAYVLYSHSIRIRRILLINLTSPPPPPLFPRPTPLLLLVVLPRVGFSKDGTTMNLGEASQSYGFGGTSKAITNAVFVDYGESFGPGDVIGCFVVRR